MIYNPWFDKHGIDAAVIPMGVRPEDYADEPEGRSSACPTCAARW